VRTSPHLPRPEPTFGRVLAGIALRAGTLALVAASPCLFGLYSPGQALGALQLACSMGGLLAVSRAARHGDRLARGGLNAWDEAAAFWAALMLLHWLASSTA
jgi:hypothetical protein